ncbi:hypothetical protein M406DRAFT_354455 [Cryphonectria parasitica EP155]|uniref:Uncharacterized protein n=1 Tax=Cryphonectria parasitica (strain ATCC 38755 / EP155) TaxID=660469 RepID=A0A9P4YBR2_CRYP1|nr:uncharacterized protein M406DRAFT_354455 [Cryphonectria parasitica EP155]KAF3770446.1 hypothetical protein M406DRAFT_354455 [Cryphonectria parasitica EP155]
MLVGRENARQPRSQKLGTGRSAAKGRAWCRAGQSRAERAVGPFFSLGGGERERGRDCAEKGPQCQCQFQFQGGGSEWTTGHLVTFDLQHLK